MLLIFGGLPAVGKSVLARHMAQTLCAVYLRIDTIEQAMRDGGFHPAGPEGYMVAYGVAKDNLAMGLTVVADAVNPIEITRSDWRKVALDVNRPYCEIEVVCTDPREHQLRVNRRVTDIPGLVLPDWEAVKQRTYEPWKSACIVMDTAGQTPEESTARLEKRFRDLYPGFCPAPERR